MSIHRRRVTVASEELRRHLSKKRGAIADLAKELGVGSELVSRWTTGWRRPSTPVRLTLQRRFRISWVKWDQDVEPGPDVRGAA